MNSANRKSLVVAGLAAAVVGAAACVAVVRHRTPPPQQRQTANADGTGRTDGMPRAGEARRTPGRRAPARTAPEPEPRPLAGDAASAAAGPSAADAPDTHKAVADADRPSPAEAADPQTAPKPAKPSPAAAKAGATPPAARAAAPQPVAGPMVPEPMARLALGYVGADPDADAVWAAAINDPNLSPKARKDLIEDLNEDGFPDPKHITEDDLPLILSRIGLIEQLAPDAMDEVNAAAFEEAYKDLVNMFARLTGGQ